MPAEHVAPHISHLLFLDDRDELVERFSPTLVKSHRFVLLARFFVAVKNERRVPCSVSMRLKRNDRGKEERNTGRRLRRLAWPIAGRQRIGSNELFILDDFEVTTGVQQFLSLR